MLRKTARQLVPVVPASGVAFALSAMGFLSASPWAVTALLFTAGLTRVITDRDRGPTTGTLHRRLGLRMLTLNAALYATGWGPLLVIVHFLPAAAEVRRTGPRALAPTLAWSAAVVIAGQLAIAARVAPTAVPIAGELEASVVHMVAVFMWITLAFATITLAQMVRRLKASETRYRQLFEQVHDALYVHDLEGNFQMFNEAALQLTGYSPEDAGHVKVRDLVAPEYHPFLDDLNPLIFADEALPPWQVDIIAKDGQRTPVEVSVHLLRDDTGTPYGVLGVARDATERKRVENALRESERKYAEAYEREREAAEHLRTLDALKSDFLSMVSHELRTPLTSIKGFTDTLLDHWERLDDLRRRDFIERISTQATGLDGLIAQLLDFSRWEGGKLEVRLQPHDLGNITTEMLEALPALDAHHLEVDIPPDTVVQADRDACHRIFDNLLTNAAKFSEPQTTIRVDASPQGSDVVVSVSDEGIGIDPRESDRIFDRFYRVERGDRSRTGGTGIGLAIVRQYVEAQGGRVWVEARHGRGSTFRFTLRRAPVSIGQEATRARSTAGSEQHGPHMR